MVAAWIGDGRLVAHVRECLQHPIIDVEVGKGDGAVPVGVMLDVTHLTSSLVHESTVHRHAAEIRGDRDGRHLPHLVA